LNTTLTSFLLALSSLLLAIFIFNRGKNDSPPIFSLAILDNPSFLSAISRTYPTSEQNIVAGVVPHHALAGELIGGFFSALPKPRTIVILGPNHAESGSANIQASDYIWETPVGSVETDLTLLANLGTSVPITTNNQVVSSDQSIVTLIPYLAHYLPGVKVVPLVLKYTTLEEECLALAKALSALPDVLVVGSIDFAHNLDSKTSEKNSNIVLSSIKNRNYEDILSMQSDYLDSPPSLVTVLMYADLLGSGRMEILASADSGDFDSPYSPGTGYLSLVFYAK